ncbi:MAG: efflux RND transporter periplasmic adaptor subunit [Acetobacteraceae bacterium]|nr:efflux RND transporter periplasmic adaptor subunit [Acetobacteraceae bacterium]
MGATQTSKPRVSMPGWIREVFVDRGDVVRRGQLLAQIAAESDEAQLALARLRARNDAPVLSAEQKAECARRRAERIGRLRSTQAASEREHDEAMTEARVAVLALQDARMSLAVAEAEVRRAEEVVAQRRILGPLDGVVVERNLSAGEYLHEQVHLMTLAQIDPLHVEIYLPVACSGQVREGDAAIVMPEAPDGGRHSAQVVVVDRVIDAASGNLRRPASVAQTGSRSPGEIALSDPLRGDSSMSFGSLSKSHEP